MQVLINLCCAIIAYGSGDIGDITFGSSRPNIQFSGSIITPTIVNDDIIEGEEIGQFKIFISGSSSFNGFAPRFQSVRMLLTDDDGKVTIVMMQNFMHVYFLIVSSYSYISSSSICSRKHCIISGQYNTAPSSHCFITII